MITLGYQRPLQAPDLWRMDPSREARLLSTQLDEAWARRVAKAKEWNARLASGEIKPSIFQRSEWYAKSLVGKGSYSEQEVRWRTVDGKRHASLTWALNDVLGRAFWAGGALAGSPSFGGGVLTFRSRSLQSRWRYSSTYGSLGVKVTHKLRQGTRCPESCWGRTSKHRTRDRYGHRFRLAYGFVQRLYSPGGFQSC